MRWTTFDIGNWYSMIRFYHLVRSTGIHSTVRKLVIKDVHFTGFSPTTTTQWHQVYFTHTDAYPTAKRSSVPVVSGYPDFRKRHEHMKQSSYRSYSDSYFRSRHGNQRYRQNYWHSFVVILGFQQDAIAPKRSQLPPELNSGHERNSLSSNFQRSRNMDTNMKTELKTHMLR
jgi:hypothetical protein